MKFTGVFNIQFVLYDNNLYVLEVNPRASRTVPVMSKVTNVNLIQLATQTLLGEKLANETNVLLENKFYTVKASVFSTAKLRSEERRVGKEGRAEWSREQERGNEP